MPENLGDKLDVLNINITEVISKLDDLFWEVRHIHNYLVADEGTN